MDWLRLRLVDIDRIPHRSFEAIVAEVLKGKGWSVELTRQTCNGGFDILAISTNVLDLPIRMIAIS
jgi:hypothetical protein